MPTKRSDVHETGGTPHRGSDPLGYVRDPQTRKLLIDAEKAPIVVEMFERRAKGKSWADISHWAFAAHDHYYARATISTMLHNPAYLGHARQGDLVNEKAHKPLVSRKLWDEAHAARGTRPAFTGASRGLLLRGIATCANCGHKMVIGNSRGPGGTKVSSYVCRNLPCKKRAYARAAGRIDKLVTGQMLALLASAGANLTNPKASPADLVQAERDLAEAAYALDLFRSNKKAITTLGLDAWNELLEEYVVSA